MHVGDGENGVVLCMCGDVCVCVLYVLLLIFTWSVSHPTGSWMGCGKWSGVLVHAELLGDLLGGEWLCEDHDA